MSVMLWIFQFTPLREGRPARRPPACRACDFNSRPSARGDEKNVKAQKKQLISIHAPPRGATTKQYPQTIADLFQFTPLREGRRSRSARRVRPSYFNSRPSARGDGTDREYIAQIMISIHAPPRGATVKEWVFEHYSLISIHAPPRGATAKRKPSSRRKQFQFTPLREGRQGGCTRNHLFQGISIHAPPRGATEMDGAERADYRDFNSRPSARGDNSGAEKNNKRTNFNSRPSARGDFTD